MLEHEELPPVFISCIASHLGLYQTQFNRLPLDSSHLCFLNSVAMVIFLQVSILHSYGKGMHS